MSAASILFHVIAAPIMAWYSWGAPAPADVSCQGPFVYGSDPRWNTLELYRPSGAGSPLPVIVSTHGGGYVYGSTKEYRPYCMTLAEQGFAVISFNYHLAPRFQFPMPLYDLNAVLHWIADHADTYGLDPQQVVLLGDSAGAQITSQYAAIAANPDYQKYFGFSLSSCHISAVGLNCGMYDESKFINGQSGPAWLMREYFTDDMTRWGEQIRVRAYLTAQYPPAYLISAPGDFLLSHCQPMAQTLQDLGVPCAYKIYGTKNTKHVFHLNLKDPLAQQATQDEIDFFRRFIRF